jgi:uncharacterized protein (TIGR03435 family)
MVRRLLEDRFQLKAHWETKEFAAVYQLVVSKPGRLKKSDAGPCPDFVSTPDSPASSSPERGPAVICRIRRAIPKATN